MIKKILGLFLVLVSGLVFAAPAAYVHDMSGSGSASSKGTVRALAVGGLLEEGDVINVDRGNLTLKFEDGQIVVLQEKSRFVIEAYKYNRTKVAESNVVLSLLSGGMRYVTGVIGGTRREAIALKAGTATIGIRGTDLVVVIAGAEYVVAVQSGSIQLTRSPTQSQVYSQGAGANLPPAQLTLVARLTGQELPGTNPVGVPQQAALAKAVADATTIMKDATKTDAEKAAAARDVQAKIITALQATKTAIEQALSGGAPRTTVVTTQGTQGTQPGVQPQTQSLTETQQIINTINQNLPPAQQINPAPALQLEQQLQTASPTTALTTEQTTTLQSTSTLLQSVPTTCGGVGQSPC